MEEDSVFHEQLEPEGQFKQADEPNTLLYVALSQAVHAPPSGPVKSYVQIQSVMSSDAGPLVFVLTGHCVHDVLVFWVSVYVFGGQMSHSNGSGTTKYVPAPQKQSFIEVEAGCSVFPNTQSVQEVTSLMPSL